MEQDPDSIESFRTDRLSAERLRASHLPELRRMYADPRVTATLGGLRSDDWVVDYVQRTAEHWDRHGFGLWVLRDPLDASFVGRGGLRHALVEGVDEVEVGYALMSEYWGRGLATEFARAALAIAFTRLALPNVVSFTQPTNFASRRVMEKCGLTFERNIVYADLPHVLYRRLAP